MSKRARRVRMFQCEHGGTISRAGKRSKSDECSITCCPHCGVVGLNSQSNTWLWETDDKEVAP